MAKVIVFIGLSVTLALVSRASLRAPGSHGFYRFLAWELILALVLLNYQGVHAWFGDPLSLHQIISWSLLTASTILVVWGVHLLNRWGKPEPEARDDTSLIGIERTTRLVTTGAYKYIRHPLYSSLLFLAWGVFFKDPSWLGGGLAAAATVFLIATGKVEESENVRYFGDDYEAYMKRTKMLVPFLF